MADDDECSENEGICRAGAECVNFDGSYSCPCKKGYFKKDDECLKGKPLKKEPMICTLKELQDHNNNNKNNLKSSEKMSSGSKY